MSLGHCPKCSIPEAAWLVGVGPCTEKQARLAQQCQIAKATPYHVPIDLFPAVESLIRHLRIQILSFQDPLLCSILFFNMSH